MFAPQPTRLVLSTPGSRPFGRSLPDDRSRSALVRSQHLDGLLQKQGRAHVAARCRQGFAAPVRRTASLASQIDRPSGTRSATPKKLNSQQVLIEDSGPTRAVPDHASVAREHHESSLLVIRTTCIRNARTARQSPLKSPDAAFGRSFLSRCRTCARTGCPPRLRLLGTVSDLCAERTPYIGPTPAMSRPAPGSPEGPPLPAVPPLCLDSGGVPRSGIGARNTSACLGMAPHASRPPKSWSVRCDPSDRSAYS